MVQNMVKENGKVVRCPICESDDIEAIRTHDYVKMCNNNKCSYKRKHIKTTGWRYQFSTGVHN